MQIPLERAVDTFIGYMSEQVAKIPKGIERFLGFLALGGLKNNPSSIISKIRPWMEMAGILTDNMVDVRTAKAALDMAFANVPNVSYFGFTFTSDDVDALIGKMQGVTEPKEATE